MTLVIKEATAALRRTPIMSVMTALVIAISLALCGILGMLARQANDSLEAFRAKVTVEAFFDPSVSSEEASATVDEKIKPISAITSLSFISKEDALSEYEKNSGEDVTGILGYNPLPASVRMTFSNLHSDQAKDIRKQLLSVEGVKDVLYDEKSLRTLEERSQSLYLLAIILGGIFLVVSIAIVTSTIRLALESRRDGIHAMKLLGAGGYTIRIPYIIEGSFAGCIGGICAGGLILLFHFFVLPFVIPELITHISGAKDYTIVFGSGAVIGIIIGMIGSTIASWRIAKL